MAPKGRPAFVEDFDESQEDVVPNSQQVANTGAKVSSRLDPRFQEPLIDVASDSGYSSRTAATVNSTQSGPSGGRSPPPLKTDLPKQRTTDLARTTSHRDRRDKERAARRHEEKVQMAAYGPTHLQTRVHRSPSKSNRRNSYQPSPAEIYYEGSRPYHTSTPVDPRPMDYYSPMLTRPPVPDFGPPMSPHSIYPPEQEYHSSRSAYPHPSGSYHRSPIYHQDPRPGPWAVGLRGFPPHQQQPLAPPPPPNHGYERGPPPPSGAWHQGSYSSSPYGAPSYAPPDYNYPQEPMYRERSESRPPREERSRARRSSVYAQQPPQIAAEPEMFHSEWEDEPGVEDYYRHASEKPRGRGSKPISPDYEDDPRRRRMSKAPSPDYEEDTRRMPPPSSRPTQKAAKIHQQRTRPDPRKVQSAAAVPQNRHSSAFDMFELDDILDGPEFAAPRRPKELPPALNRSQSVQGGRRSISYRENRRSGVMENSLRRPGRDSTYYHDSRGNSSVEDMEEAERTVEEYQRMTSGLPANGHAPLSDETLLSKARTGLPSESGSRKSGSNSSRGSATKTEKENQNMTLSLNGMTIGFAEESLTGKSISIRTGDQGSMQFNITDGSTPAPRRQNKQYVPESTYSRRTGSDGRRALENGARYARTHDDGRSEKSVHRSSRSGRSSHGQRYH